MKKYKIEIINYKEQDEIRIIKLKVLRMLNEGELNNSNYITVNKLLNFKTNKIDSVTNLTLSLFYDISNKDLDFESSISFDIQCNNNYAIYSMFGYKKL